MSAPAFTVTEPGVYPGIPDAVYHADPVPGGSLSSTGAKKLLPPSCPALFQHDRTHGHAPRDEFDFGHAAHTFILGDGPEIDIIDHPDWKSKAAQEARDEARHMGVVPLLRHEHDQIQDMVAAVREHPVAGPLLAPGAGIPEQSYFWQDGPTGVWRRARPDWTPHGGDGRLVLVDYKTTREVSVEAIQRSIHAYGYHQQAAWYLDGAKALGLTGDQEPAFVFVFQMKTEPYLVHLVELDMPALAIGAAKNRRAIEIYAECQRTGVWPSFNDRISYLPLPPWAEKRDQEEYL